MGGKPTIVISRYDVCVLQSETGRLLLTGKHMVRDIMCCATCAGKFEVLHKITHVEIFDEMLT